MMIKPFVFCLLLAASSIHAECLIGAMEAGTTELTGSYLTYSFNNVLQQGTTYMYVDKNIVIGEDQTFYLTIGVSGNSGGCILTSEKSYADTFKWNGTAKWKGENTAPIAFFVPTSLDSYCFFNFGGDIASISFRANTDKNLGGKVQFLTSDKVEVGCADIISKPSSTVNEYAVNSYRFTGGSDGKQFPKYMNISSVGWAFDNMRIVMSAGVVNEPTQEEPVAAPVKKSSASFTSAVALVGSIAIGLIAALL